MGQAVQTQLVGGLLMTDFLQVYTTQYELHNARINNTCQLQR